MRYVSFSSILTIILACYVIHTIWTLAELFIPPKCSRGDRCLSSYLSTNPVQHLLLFTSVNPDYYVRNTLQKVYTGYKLDYTKPTSFDITLKLSERTLNNGTLYMHAMLVDDGHETRDYSDIWQSESIFTLPLTIYTEPRATTFNLLESKEDLEGAKGNGVQPYSHITTEVPLGVLSEDLKLPANKIPPELYSYVKLRRGKYLPIVQHNVLKSRLSHYQLINSSMTRYTMTVTVAPISYGALRLSAHVRIALQQLHALGFSDKDVDDVKGIFADTNLYLLSATVLIATCHLLFDFLAFKNDVSFWRSKRTLAGLSGRTVLWRGFSQFVIFLYLLDQQTSMLVLVPSAISAVIELWKVTKVLHLRISFAGWRIRIWREKSDDQEQDTARADAEAMRYLSMLLYPLCIAGAIYSLVYEPHKSWYSWALSSIVNGVYAFGFLFMLPQLFVNYRLRSVAALPWRAFMYKAFNTFIDDVFAFIITMPTAHRMACFRDDLVFLVYLYQRWLYPVDMNRIDSALSMDESPTHNAQSKQTQAIDTNKEKAE